jgi:hypothetical protein
MVEDVKISEMGVSQFIAHLYSALNPAEQETFSALNSETPTKQRAALSALLHDKNSSEELKTAIAWQFWNVDPCYHWLFKHSSGQLLERLIYVRQMDNRPTLNILILNKNLTAQTILLLQSKVSVKLFREFVMALPVKKLTSELLSSLIQERRARGIADRTLLAFIHKVSAPEERELPDEWLLKIYG